MNTKLKTGYERWLAERDHLLYLAEIGSDGDDDPWMWKVLFLWATPDLWDDEEEKKT